MNIAPSDIRWSTTQRFRIMLMPKQAFIGQFCSRMVSLHRRTKIALMVSADLVALPFCFLIAMLLRGGDLKLASHFGPASYVLVAVVTIAAFSMSDLYRAVIRFIDQRLLSVTGLRSRSPFYAPISPVLVINEEQFPRSALAIYWFIVFSYVVASRIGMRNFLRNHARKRASRSGRHLRRRRGRRPPGAGHARQRRNTARSAFSTTSAP
jgi:hypothetical protein